MGSSNQIVVLWRYANQHHQYGACQAVAFSDLASPTKSRKIQIFEVNFKGWIQIIWGFGPSAQTVINICNETFEDTLEIIPPIDSFTFFIVLKKQ